MKSALASVAGIAIGVTLLAGCASIEVKHPGIDTVKKVAVISVTSNYEIGDIEAKNKQEDSSLGTLLGAAITKAAVPSAAAEQVAIVTYGDRKIGQMFGELNGWALVSGSAVTGNADYKALFVKDSGNKATNAITNGLMAISTADWVVPQGQQVIPLDNVAPQENRYVNGERGEAPTLRNLGELCTKLGVDAVVVAEVNLAYKSTFLSNTSGTGLFANVRGKAKPVVQINVAVVNQKGELVMKSNRGWGSFEGKEVPMMFHGEVDLKDDKGECVKGYNATIDTAVDGLKAQITKALGGK
jgi:hypothetical protein